MAIVAIFEFPDHTIDEYRKVFEIGGADIVHQPACTTSPTRTATGSPSSTCGSPRMPSPSSGPCWGPPCRNSGSPPRRKSTPPSAS